MKPHQNTVAILTPDRNMDTVAFPRNRAADKPRRYALLAALLAIVVAGGGCKTGKGTGTLIGTGLGAAIGAAAGEGEGALIGGAIGAGVGYIIGDQVDEKKAKEMTANGGTHNEVGPLGGTKWRVVSLHSSKEMEPYESKIVEFYPYGQVVTTTTKPGGNVETYNES